MPNPPDLPQPFWYHEAACINKPIDNYTTNRVSIPKQTRDDYAQTVCTNCPVVASCAADALIHADIGVVRAGVWLDSTKHNQTPELQKRLIQQIKKHS